jgi:hypothetical protein
MIGAGVGAPLGVGVRLLRVHRRQAAPGVAYWRWQCRFCGEYGGGRDQPDALARALRHCTEHPHHLSSLVPASRCAQVWPLPVPDLVPTVYERLLAAQLDGHQTGSVPV